MSGPAHVDLTELARRLRKAGRTVVIVDGAQGRAARMFTEGYNLGCQASGWHHTVSSGSVPAIDIQFLINGLGDGWVIANAYIPPDGVIYLVASGPTYTEGRGGPLGIIAANGANRVCWSTEIANWGDGVDVYDSPEQTDSVLTFAAVLNPYLAEVYEWPDPSFSQNRMFAHHEWSPGRKIDPRGPSPWADDGGMWDMNQFRADAQNLAKRLDGTVELLEDLSRSRQIDTREGVGGGKVVAGERRAIKIDHPDVPADATGLFVNLTSAQASGPGFLTVWPGGGDRPNVTHLSYDGGPADSQSTYIVIQPDRFTNLYASSDTHVIIDVLGYV